MKIDMITGPTYSTRVLPWHSAAVNDPKIHRWYAADGSAAPPEDRTANGDWSSACFMDDKNKGLMCLNINRADRSGSVSLWVLDGDTIVAASMIRYLVNVLSIRYMLRSISFSIAETNEEWLDRMNEMALEYRYGIEPEGIFDPMFGRYVSAHRYKIILKDGITLQQILRSKIKRRK